MVVKDKTKTFRYILLSSQAPTFSWLRRLVPTWRETKVCCAKRNDPVVTGGPVQQALHFACGCPLGGWASMAIMESPTRHQALGSLGLQMSQQPPDPIWQYIK